MNERYLEQRAAIVTGGATGQGRAIALALAGRGCHVAIGSRLDAPERSAARVFTNLPSQSQMDAVCQEIEQQGVRALGRDHDLGSNQSCEALYRAAVDAFGKVDILINAAGIYLVHPITDHPDEDWHRVIDINLTGAYRMTKLALPSMIDNGWGRIINITSTAANVGGADNAAYCASKSGLLGLTRCVALEGAPHGVTCNAINPGWVDTGMMDQAFASEARQSNHDLRELVEAFAADRPQKRALSPREIAAVAAFLCHEDSRGLTMEDITVAGGALW